MEKRRQKSSPLPPLVGRSGSSEFERVGVLKVIDGEPGEGGRRKGERRWF